MARLLECSLAALPTSGSTIDSMDSVTLLPSVVVLSTLGAVVMSPPSSPSFFSDNDSLTSPSESGGGSPAMDINGYRRSRHRIKYLNVLDIMFVTLSPDQGSFLTSESIKLTFLKGLCITIMKSNKITNALGYTGDTDSFLFLKTHLVFSI